MRLYAKKISSYWEINEYKKGSKKIIISAESPVTSGNGIVLFNRANMVACVMEVTKVERAGNTGPFYIYVRVLNSDDQDIPIEYFGYTGIDGIRFIGYSAFCKRLKISNK